MLLSGIIYLHPISDVRWSHSSMQSLKMFRKMCGDDKLENAVLATTKWEDTPKEIALRREEELINTRGF